MGFFAAELETILADRAKNSARPWSVLSRMGVHPQQIDRLKKAAEDVRQVASLPEPSLEQVRVELELTPYEWARLRAGMEADVTLRMTDYHGYSNEDIMNMANTIFSNSLKDRIAQEQIGLTSEQLTSAFDTAMQRAGVGRRGRGINRRVEDVDNNQQA